MAYLYFRTALRVCRVLPIIPTAEMSVVVIVRVREEDSQWHHGDEPVHGLARLRTKVLC